MKKAILILGILFSSTVFAQRYKPAPTKEELLNEKYCRGLFSTPDATYFDLENDNSAIAATSYLNILDWLQGRVAGLQVYSWRNLRIPFLRNQPAAIFVDEIQVDAGFLNALPTTDIAMIKVIKGSFIGAWGAQSAIAVYTKDGADDDDE